MEEKPRVIYKMKKSTGKTVAIVILLMLLFCSCSYIGYLKYLENQNQGKAQDKEERKEIYYSEASTILSQIDLYNEVFSSIYPINDITKVDNQLKLQFALLALKKDENINNYYKIEDMKEMYYRYFKEGFKAIYEDIECPSQDEVLYKLDHDTKTYTYQGTHEHGKSSIDIDTYFISGKINEDKYIINTHILYSNYCNGTCDANFLGYYSTYQDSVDKKSKVMDKRSDYDLVKDELPVTTFTFVKKKNNFKLESIKSN